MPAGKTTVAPDPAASRARTIAAVSSVAPSPRAPKDVTSVPAGRPGAGGADGDGAGGAVVAAGGAVVAAGGAVVAAGGVVAPGGAVVAAGGAVVDAGGAVDAAGGAVIDGGAVVGAIVGGAAVVVAVAGGVEATVVGAAVPAVVGAVVFVEVAGVVPLGLATLVVGSAARAAGAARSSPVTDAPDAAAVGVVAPRGGSIASATSRMPRATVKRGTTAKRIRRPVLPQRLGPGPTRVGQAALQAERPRKRASDG